jgi:endonuclease/exonuclease/phosphatase (EEP) superfamily protein YafD
LCGAALVGVALLSTSTPVNLSRRCVALRPDDGTSQVVRVIQANIKFDLPAPAFTDDLAALSAVSPDLVSLNEVGLREDRLLTPPGYNAFRALGGGPQARSTAVLWRRDRWERVAGGRTRLVRTGPRPADADRSASWATLRGIKSNARVGTLSLVSVHMMVNPKSYGPDRERRRKLYRRAMVALGDLVRGLSAAGPVVVAGDFNSQWSDDDPWGPRTMLAPLEGATGMISTMDLLGALTTYDAGGTIDYVFFQPSSTAPLAQSAIELTGSDHKAVIADLCVRSASRESSLPTPWGTERGDRPSKSRRQAPSG